MFRNKLFHLPNDSEFPGNMKKNFLMLAGPALISALLLRLSFPKPSLYPLAFFALVPFFFTLMHLERPLDGLLCGAIFGIAFHYSNIFWLNTLSAYNSFIYIGIALLGIYLGLYGALFGWLSVLLKKGLRRITFLLFASLWVSVEYLRNVGQLSFPWSYLSATQAHNLPLIQICDITGVWGVSFLLAIINAALADFFLSLKTRHSLREGLTPPAVALTLLVVTLFYGAIRLKHDFKGEYELRVALLQPDIPQKMKFAGYAGTDVETKSIPPRIDAINFEMLKNIQTGGADLVILPESATITPYFGLQKELLSKIGAEAQRISAGIFIGANREVFFDESGHEVGPAEKIASVEAYNSAWYFLPNSNLFPRTYDKIHLVPFGEYLPYFDLIPGFQRIIVQTGSFMKGKNYTLFPIEAHGQKFLFGSVICFESSFGWLLRRLAGLGADFLVIITNDGWYEDSAGPYQHYDLSIFRAIETRRYVLRSANRGISAIIEPTGYVANHTSLNRRETLTGSIYPRPSDTVYKSIGDLSVLPYFALPLYNILNLIKRKKRGKPA